MQIKIITIIGAFLGLASLAVAAPGKAIDDYTLAADGADLAGRQAPKFRCCVDNTCAGYSGPCRAEWGCNSELCRWDAYPVCCGFPPDSPLNSIPEPTSSPDDAPKGTAVTTFTATSVPTGTPVLDYRDLNRKF